MNNLELQSTCFQHIKTLCVNYRKDSSTRKTVDYLNQRLATLESQWKEFEDRHALLLLELEDKDIDYIKDDVYTKTKEMYVTTKTDITNRLTNKANAKQRVKFDLSETSNTGEQAEYTDDIQLLLNKQECNFNAICRTISKIRNISSAEKWDLEDNLSTLKSRWEAIDKLHWQIDFHLKGTNEHYYEMFSEIEDKYEDLRRSIKAKIWSTAHYQKSTPKIEIPEFSGSYKQWISFKDLFLETIDKNPAINNAQKMQHLKTKLRGEAEQLVKHLNISAENYTSCWDILLQRYDNRRLQFSEFMNTMLNLPTIQQSDAFNLKRLHDTITECFNGITNIGYDTATWDPMIVHIMTQKLDSNTLREYTRELQDRREMQSLQEFLSFLEGQFMSYETMKSAKKGNFSSSEKNSNNNLNKQNHIKKANYNFNKTHNYFATFGNCPLCSGNHVLMQCEKFIAMDSGKRHATVTKLQVCKNCLYSHGSDDCKSRKTCRECNLKHHTLLHNKNKTSRHMEINIMQQPASTSKQTSSNHLHGNDMEVLLTTVLLKVKSIDGTYITLRALLDQGSQTNLITENAAQLLRLPRRKISASVTGIGSVSGECRGLLNITCKSIHSEYSFETNALIMKTLTNNLPTTTFKKSEWPHLKNLKLADPDFNVSRPVDILLGADVYSKIIRDGLLKANNQSPVAQQTHVGWILCGKLKTLSCHVTLIDLEKLTKFWETEDIQQSSDLSKDNRCEQLYQKTVQRTQDGRYIVQMPLVPDYKEKLGNSKSVALSQYFQLEKRLYKNPKLLEMYKQFLKEYSDLGHMKPSSTQTKTNISCYLPHHGVLREKSTTTKLRVVFNASQRTSSGYSLNNLMDKGPNLQKDLITLILKWRTYTYVFTADIEKMYRCILIAEDQRHLQKILWRDSRDGTLQDYELCTVTYGTKAAPWLAMRTLKQLTIDDGHMYPDAAKVLETECYVDDVLCGNNSYKKAQELQQSLIQLLRGGGMNLRKWTSNNTNLLKNLNADQISPQTLYDFKTDESSKTLGLGWNPTSDTFHFNWSIKSNRKQTKRSLLSDISKFYDPLGWLSPVTIKAKLLFQNLWTNKLSWDDELPADIEHEWLKLKAELHYIKGVKINRWTGKTESRIELLGFCDASEKAYAAVIYSRVWDEHGLPTVTLLVSKTRVAPIRQKTTLPKLELCGALLLANLMEKTKHALSEYNITIEAWCDSQVVLAWIQGDSSRWETYIANRVTKIKHTIPETNWRFVKSEMNPADCASRGLLPSKLLNFNLWWEGPEFLKKQKCSENPLVYETNFGCINHTETKCKPLCDSEHLITTLLNKYSSLTHTTRVIAWIQRFYTNLRHKTKPNTKYLTTNELSAATTSIVSYIQRTWFNPEYNQLINNKTLSSNSKIYKLAPFLDKDGIIRVGGRLKNSSLPPGMKNPAIIPHTGRYTQLIIEQAHLNTLHGGARLTLLYLRQQYWIIGGNRAVKTQLKKCVRCHRFNNTTTKQLMGDLPRQRVTPCRPFTHTGVDFTGHVDIKLNKGRGVKTSKGYIAIFICMATKAVHIELVSDLSTETFIAAFQRLCARRGVPKHMYSDCGTNFVGASKVLQQEFIDFKQLMKPEFFRELTKLQVEWHFNAPAWPSAGGIWEAAVKSMKHHLKRVLGDQKLTYEEFATLLVKIEACLNSRPLCPLTEDPEEFYNCLTPGHFLTGSPILSLPLSDYNDVKTIDLRRRWQLMEHMFHRYWKTWSNEYLTTLQARSKWNKATKNIKQGDIVLVKEDNLPPGKWALGRVLKTHPGSDGHVRVVTIQTESGILKRPVIKLSPLPTTTEIDNDKNHEPPKKLKRESRKNTNKNISSLLITMLTLFTFISGCYSVGDGTRQVDGGAQITCLERERPVYYDTIGKVQTMHDEWILLMYYNLTNYWEGTRRLKTYVENLKNICDRTKLQPCRTTLEQIGHEVDILNYYNFALINPHKHLSNRKKRGLVNGVGYLANSLFGILDQNFADKYQNDIQSLQNNENYLFDLIKNQTTIVELENQVLKQSETNIQRQFHLIDEFINSTNANLASIETEMEILSTTTYITSASLNAYMLIHSLRTFQEMLFNTLTNVYQGHMDVHLITPVHLIQQLSQITGSFPKGLSLPVENYKENIKDLYELITVKARVTENYFLFETHIPLISDEDYYLYRTIPLPFKKGSEMSRVSITTNYIAVNLQKNIYISITEDDLKLCTQQKTNNFVCKKNLPSFDLHSVNAPCEAKLLSHQNAVPCDIEHITCKDAWIELHSPNSWLAICCDKCALRTICNEDVTLNTLASSSVVTLAPGCILQSKDLTIYAHRQYKSRMEMDYKLTVPTLDGSINSIVNLTYRYAPESKQSNAFDVQFKTIEEKLDTQRTDEAVINHMSITSHDIHQYVICYGLLALAILCVVVVGRKRCRAALKRKTKQHTENIELQTYNLQKITATESPSIDRVSHHIDPRPVPSRRDMDVTTGTRNIAFNFD